MTFWKRLNVPRSLLELLALLICVILIFSSIRIYQQGVEVQSSQIQQLVENTTRRVSNQFSNFITDRLGILRSVEYFLENSNIQDVDEINDYLRYTYGTVPGLLAINWIDERGIIVRVNPTEPNLPALGKDLHQHPYAAETFMRAEKTGAPQITPIITLWQGGYGFASYFPVTIKGKRIGYVNGVFRLDETLLPIIQSQAGNQFIFNFYQDGKKLTHYGETDDTGNFTFRLPLLIFSMNWELEGVSTRKLESTFPERPLFLFLIFGILLSILIGVLMILFIRKYVQYKSLAHEHKKARQELANVFDRMTDGLMIFDQDFKIYRSNSAVADILHIHHTEILGKDCREVLSTATRQNHLQHAFSNLGMGKPVELEIESPSLKKSLLISIAPYQNSSHQATGGILLIRDITDYIRLKNELHQVQKMEAIGQLAGGIAHDFNNILTSMMGYAELLLMRVQKDEKSREQLMRILESGKRASQLVEKLLSFSRKKSPKAQPINVNQIIQETVDLLQRTIEENISIHVDLYPSQLVIESEEVQIQQILMNLCSNARDAMPDGGEITIRTEKIKIYSPRKAHHGTLQPGEYALLEVKDTGSGIPETILPYIFDPFFTTKATGRGTGLGLAMVYGIVVQHGGCIDLETKPGEGTTFRIYFPISTMTPGARASENEKKVRKGTETILVTEDDASIRGMATEYLKQLGYKVIEASNGIEAIQMIEKYGKKLSLVFIDTIMPGLSGREVFLRMHDKFPAIKFLFTSGYSMNLLDKAMLSHPAVSFIPKPFKLTDLAQKIRLILDQA